MVVLHVGLEMIGQVGDALSEDRDLHFRRTGVAGLQRIVFNERGLALGGDRHRSVLLAGGGKTTADLCRPSRDVVQVGRLGPAASAPGCAAYTGFSPRRQRNPARAERRQRRYGRALARTLTLRTFRRPSGARTRSRRRCG